jgi:hypothetical protein
MKLSKALLLNLAAATLLTVPMLTSFELSAQPEKEEVSSEPLAIQQPPDDIKAPAEEQKVQNGANFTTSHNRSNHIYMGTTLYGDQVKIEDDSYWMTNPDDRLKLFDWWPGDTVIVLQNNGSFWSKPAYPYILLNTRNDQRIEVELSAAPLWDLRFFIIEIGKPVYGDGYLKLNDGTIWKYWEPNDTMIIGINESIFNIFTPNILINVTCDQKYVISRCTNY